MTTTTATAKTPTKTRARKKRGPGQPPWNPDAATRRRVCRLVSVGLTHAAIALRLGISKPTLLKHCSEELINGADLARAELFEMMFGAADKGNVAAMKELRALQAAAGARDSILRDAEQPEAAPAPVERLGKKEMQRRAAEKAGQDSEWGADLGTLPNDNPQ